MALHVLLLSCLAPRGLAGSSSAVAAGFAYSPSLLPKTAPTPRFSDLGLGGDGSGRRCHQPLQLLPRRRRGYESRADIGTLATSATDASSGDGSTEYVWEVYVSQPSSKHKNKEKGAIPTSSLIQAFNALAPSPDYLRVHAASFQKQGKQKGKGQFVRCIKRKKNVGGGDSDGEMLTALDIVNVDSVDKVYRTLTHHMKLENVNPKAYECMRCFFEGNQRLEEGEPSQAISLYDQAFDLAEKQPSQLPKGSILMKRARAYLKRAAKHRTILRMHVKDLTDTVPSASTMKVLYQTAASHPALSSTIFQRLAGDSKVQQAKFRQIRYRHDMLEFAWLHAVQDSLQATQILPQNAQAWLLAGECLAELRKLKESNQYYQRALEIDPSMEKELKGVMEKNRASQEFMDKARASGFSGDTLRLALDVAA